MLDAEGQSLFAGAIVDDQAVEAQLLEQTPSFRTPALVLATERDVSVAYVPELVVVMRRAADFCLGEAKTDRCDALIGVSPALARLLGLRLH